MTRGFRRRKERRLARWLVAIAIALAFNGLLGSAFVLTKFGGAGHLPKKDLNPVALRSVSGSTWAQNRALGPRPPPDKSQASALPKPVPPKPEVKKEPEPLPKGKVVDVAPGNDQKPDEDSKFLAEHNNRVDKETVSKDATPFYKNAMPRPSTNVKPSEDANGRDPAQQQAQAAGNLGKGDDDRPLKDGQRKGIFELPSIEKRDQLALKFKGLGGEVPSQQESQEVEGNSKRLRIQPGGETGDDADVSQGRAGSENLRTLMPSAAVLDRIVGAPTNDVTPLDDVERGDGTYLNTREFKYSSFFNRVKQNVGMQWDPNTVARTRDPTGEIFLYKDRYTVVSVVLDQGGQVKDVSIDKSCGVDFLDREAISAFRRAQPFPNPPPALLDSHGEIRFTFGFFLEVSRGGMRLFRN